MRKLLPAILSLIVVSILASPVTAIPPTSFTDQDAQDLLGHTFKEEYWTAPDIPFTTADGAEVSFSMSYAQYKSVDTFLIAFNTHEKEGNVSTLPYQLFGLHYYTPEGTEIMIGAVLAFLMAFNDTHNGAALGSNGLPDPGNEDVYYVLPFGVGGTLTEEEYVPQVEPIPVQKKGEGHFRFGQRYTNLYAKVVGTNNPVEFLLSAAFPLYIARFSELTIEYEVRIDEAAGTVTAETFYTIGEVSKLWLWGQEVDPHSLGEDFGLAAVHYVVPFGTPFVFTQTDPGIDIATNITEAMDADIDMRVGDDRERAFTIGHRGKYDLIDEGPGTKIREGQDATALLLHARPVDGILVAWQALFSLDIFCTASWAVSESLQQLYPSPRALWNLARWTIFTGSPLWYATSFPGWEGYRIEHDPTYTAYANVGHETVPPEPEPKAPGFGPAMVLMAIAIPTVFYFIGNRKR
jgi:hypothetical protein